MDDMQKKKAIRIQQKIREIWTINSTEKKYFHQKIREIWTVREK